jgi:hypothetical protein
MKVSEIAVQATVAESGQAEIAEAIIVEITDGNPTWYSREGQLSGLTDILKTAIGLLLQDLQQGGGMFRQFGCGESDQDEVGQVILIQVGNSASARHDSWEQPA